MSSNLVMTESNHGFIKNNLSFNEREEDPLKNHLMEIITDMYPNKEHLNVKEIINVLKFFEEKKLLELKDDNLDESLDMLMNQYNSELQEASLDDICSIILTFLPSDFKDISFYESELSFSSDVNVKLNPNDVDETKEEFHAPAVDTNQNSNSIHNFNDNNSKVNSSNRNDDKKESKKNNRRKSKVVGIDGDSSSNNSNDINVVVPSITINSTSDSNENGSSDFLNGKMNKDSLMLDTSNSDNSENQGNSESSDNLEIIQLDKQSASGLLSFSHLLDVESHSIMSLLDTDHKNKNNSLNEKSIYDSINELSSMKLDSENTEKYFKELSTMLRQNLIKSMANCQNLLNDVKSRDHTIKTLKYEIDTLKKNFEDNKKKLNRSEREVTTLKKRETQFLENIKEYSEKELEQQKEANDLSNKYNKLVQQYDNQQSELNKIHDRSEKHLIDLRNKEEELRIALQEIEKTKENIKIEQEKQAQMKKRLKEYENQLRSIPTEIKEEVENNNLMWEQRLQEQKSIYEEQYEHLRDEIEKKARQEEELLKRNKELLLQIDSLSNQINDLKAEKELDMSLSQSLNGSTGMMKTLNVELTNALAIDYEKDKKIEENIEEINNLQEKCEILEKEIEIIKREKQDLIDKEIKWKNEKEENVILITEYLEPNLKKYMDNEVILKSTIEELNKEVIDLKQNMEIKVQELFQKSKADMFKEYENNNQLNNIKSMTCMVNDAVQTSDDMRNLIDKLGKGINDIDEMNNEMSDGKLKPPPEFNIDDNIFNDNKKEIDNFDVSIDQSDLIIADVNTIDSEVPVISCNISLMDEDLAKLNENNNKLDVIQEEILNTTSGDIITDSLLLESKNNNDNNENKLNSNDINSNQEIFSEDIFNNHDISIISKLSSLKEENEDLKEDNEEDQLLNSIDMDNKIDDDPIPNDQVANIVNQENKTAISDPNIPILDHLESKNTEDKENDLHPEEDDNVNQLINSKEENKLDTMSLTPSRLSSKHNTMIVNMNRKRKNDVKTVITFLFFQCLVIFATSLSVVLTIEKMLGIRIIMKFVDIFLEDKHYIKDEGSPS